MTNNKRKGLTLAVYPHGKGFSYVLLDNPQDIVHLGNEYTDPITNAVCMQRIDAMVEDAKPRLILLQAMDGKNSFKNPRVKKLLDEIERYAKSKGIEVRKYTREQIRDVFAQFKGRSRYEIAQRIVHYLEQYEHLLPKYRKPWMNEDYNLVIFDALSLAITHFFLN